MVDYMEELTYYSCEFCIVFWRGWRLWAHRGTGKHWKMIPFL